MPLYPSSRDRTKSFWRLVRWGGATALLAAPLVAMRFTPEVRWTPVDFVFAAIMVYGVTSAYELAAARNGALAYRTATGFALAAAFLLIWINGAVGIIGDNGNPANLVFAGVLAVALGGVGVARLAPAGMARAMGWAAGAQGVASLVAISYDFRSGTLSGGFVALWVLSALLYRHAANVVGRNPSPA